MAETKIKFERSKLTIQAWVQRTKSIFGKSAKKAEFKFLMDGIATDLVKVESVAKGDVASKTDQLKLAEASITAPDVPDGKSHYKLEAKAKLGVVDGKDYDFNDCYEVWPATLKFDLASDDNTIDYVPFFIAQGGSLIDQDPVLVKVGEVVEIPLTKYAVATAVPKSPYEFKESTDGIARLRKGKVSRKPYTAKIVSQRGGTTRENPHKQYVNLPANARLSQGYEDIRVEIGAKEDRELAKSGDEIHVRVTFDKENSARTDPARAVKTAEGAVDPKNPGAEELIYEFKVKMGLDKTATLNLDMGLAGGDLVRIDVGVTNTIKDDTLWIQNWRTIFYEVLTPHADISQRCDQLAPASLSDTLKAALKKTMDDAFIEIVIDPDGSKTYTEDDINAYLLAKNSVADLAKCCIHDASFINTVDEDEQAIVLNGGDKVLIWEQNLFYKGFRDQMIKSTQKKYGIATRWCDALAQPPRGHEDPNPLAIIFENGTAIDKDLPFHVFEHCPVKADGKSSVRSYKWRATHYDKNDGNGWKPLGLGTPGVQKFAHMWHTANLGTDDKVNAFVELTNSRKIKIKLPARVGEKDDPGHFLTDDDGVKFKIQVQLELSFSDLGTAMAARLGQVVSSTGWGKVKTNGLACQLVHETGHNLGLAYLEFKGPGEMPGGSDNRGHKTKIPGIDFPKTTHDKGRVFAGKGYAGPHCADKLFEVAKEKKNTAMLTTPWYDGRVANTPYLDLHIEAQDRDRCVMWADTDHKRQPKFCDQCLAHIKAMDARDVTKDWSA